MRPSGRQTDELRAVTIETGVTRHAEGSALIRMGDTHVLVTASIDAKAPSFLRNSGLGWVTAEYGMLPRATNTRNRREAKNGQTGRTQEIQRLIGRALRAAVDLTLFPKKTLIVDIDVLQADGGTRCAGILAGYAALHHLADRSVRDGTLAEWPLGCEVAAVSVGDGRIVEVQGGSEAGPVAAENYLALIGRGVAAVAEVLRQVRGSLA